MKHWLMGALIPLGVALTVGCSEPPQDDAEQNGEQNNALDETKGEYWLEDLSEWVSSKDPNGTGINSWDFGIATDGKKPFLVATGYELKNHSRTAVIEVVYAEGLPESKDMVGMVVRKPDGKAIDLPKARLDAIAMDLGKLEPDVRKALDSVCHAGVPAQLGRILAALAGTAATIFFCGTTVAGYVPDGMVCVIVAPATVHLWQRTRRVVRESSCELM